MHEGKYVFISYSSKDTDSAKYLKKYLAERGIACWLAVDEIAWGDDFTERIVSALNDENCVGFILLLSLTAQESTHVRREIGLADNRKLPIFPLLCQMNARQLNNTYQYLLTASQYFAFDEIEYLTSALVGKLGKSIYTDEYRERLEAERIAEEERKSRELAELKERERIAREQAEAERRARERAEAERRAREEARRFERERIRRIWDEAPTIDCYNKDEFKIEGTELKGYLGNQTEVIIPKGVTSIGYGAFYCPNGQNPRNAAFRAIKRIVIPDSVTNIGEKAFSDCSALESINIPYGVVSIGSYAFDGCWRFKSILIPASVITMGERIFGGKELTVCCYANECPSGWSKYWNVLNDGMIKRRCKVVWGYNGQSRERAATERSVRITRKIAEEFAIEGGVLKKYNGNKSEVIIPNGVTTIGSFAFSDCSSITSITIPNSVNRIEFYAFRGCSGLKSITIPNSVTKIEHDAFNGCRSLTSIIIPNSVTTIGWGAFYDCSSLLKIYCEAETKPSGWDKYFSYLCKVIWGYKG